MSVVLRGLQSSCSGNYLTILWLSSHIWEIDVMIPTSKAVVATECNKAYKEHIKPGQVTVTPKCSVPSSPPPWLCLDPFPFLWECLPLMKVSRILHALYYSHGQGSLWSPLQRSSINNLGDPDDRRRTSSLSVPSNSSARRCFCPLRELRSLRTGWICEAALQMNKKKGEVNVRGFQSLLRELARLLLIA